jgi:hypothetical protein
MPSKALNFSHKFERRKAGIAVEGPVRLTRLNDRFKVSKTKLMK